MNHQHNSSFVMGICAGAALGAGIALLLAPHTGTETRDQIRRLSREARNRVTHLAGRGREAAAGAVEQGTRAVERVADELESVSNSPMFGSESASAAKRRS